MKNSTKKLFIISSGMILLGIILTVTGIILGGFPGVQITKNGVSSPYSNAQYILWGLKSHTAKISERL